MSVTPDRAEVSSSLPLNRAALCCCKPLNPRCFVAQTHQHVMRLRQLLDQLPLVLLQNNHVCVVDSMRQNCPVCFEFLFDSTQPTAVLPCGHTIHQKCLQVSQEC